MCLKTLSVGVLAKWIIEVSKDFIDPAAAQGHHSSKTASSVLRCAKILKLETKHERFFVSFVSVLFFFGFLFVC